MRTYFRCNVLFDEDGADETLNAEHVGADRYRLENISFSALGVSRYDVVEAREHTGGMLTFVRVVAKSRHRTVRCVVDGSRTAATQQALVHELATHGLRCEALLNKYFTIDIPPGVGPDTIVDSCYHAWVAVEACAPPRRHRDSLAGPHGATARFARGGTISRGVCITLGDRPIIHHSIASCHLGQSAILYGADVRGRP